MRVITKTNCTGLRMLWMAANEIEQTEPYKKGKQARRNLVPIAENEYPMDSAPEWSLWRAGWLDSDMAWRAGCAR